MLIGVHRSHHAERHDAAVKLGIEHAVECRDDGLGEGANGFHPVVQAFNDLGLCFSWLVAVGFESLHITARTKVRAFARDDHAANIRVGFCHIERFNPCGIHGRPHRVTQRGV